jgi:glutathione S-transferase
VYPEPKLHPSDPLQKDLDRVLVEKHWMPMFKFIVPIADKIPGRVFTDEEKLKLFKGLMHHLKSFEEELETRKTPLLGGDQPCMADYMIWPAFELLEFLPQFFGDKGGENFVLPSDLENIDTWIKAMRMTDPVKSYGFSPARLAKIIHIFNETYNCDKALKDSQGL